jgi:two-component system cell cycle response regulator
MTARILVVDDIPANVKLLEARLNAEYFDVRTAASGAECLAMCAEHSCDIVLLDVMMPGMDGFEVCRRLKSNLHTAHIPVVMVTALDQPSDRIKGLEAGADDFLTKPVDELALIARVRSLARVKVMIDELRTRAATAANLGIAHRHDDPTASSGDRGKVLLVDDRPSSAERIVAALRQHQSVDVETDAQETLLRTADAGYDVIIVSLGLRTFDPLRLCSQLRSVERTRQVPLLMIADLEDRDRILRGLDLGASDYLTRPIDRNELVARLRTQIRRKRYADSLRASVQSSIEMAVVDALTGLHNRRYFESHVASLLDQSVKRGRPLSLMVLDIDHFKKVNDTFGHDAGDEVLKIFAARVKATVRTADLVCRLGGEEFVIVMPETGIDIARRIAERVRKAIESSAFPILAGQNAIPVTVSVGLADRGRDVQAEQIFKRADRALYRSKQEGRNRVSAEAA